MGRRDGDICTPALEENGISMDCSKSGADRFWRLMGYAAVIIALGISASLVLMSVAPNGLL